MAAGEGGASVSGHCWDNVPASICTDGFEIRGEMLKVGAVLDRFPLQTFNAWLGGEIALEGEANATLMLERDAEGFNARWWTGSRSIPGSSSSPPSRR